MQNGGDERGKTAQKGYSDLPIVGCCSDVHYIHFHWVVGVDVGVLSAGIVDQFLRGCNSISQYRPYVSYLYISEP